MKRIHLILILGVFVSFIVSSANATIWFSDGFETSWSGDYAPGWVNSAYRHGTAPVGKMMQQTTTSHSGSYGLELIADSVPQDWMWWAAVSIESLPHWALDKQYDPYVSVWYYDDLSVNRGGQLFAVPDWVNLYIPPGEDWTDIQFGARFNQSDFYYYVAVGQSHPGWQSTGIARSLGWHNLKFQLSSADGRVHFYVDNNAVGTSYRNDYTNLGTEIGLYTMFQNPLSGWSEKPYTLWDDIEVGSSAVPEPGTLILLGAGLVGLAGYGRFRLIRRKK